MGVHCRLLSSNLYETLPASLVSMFSLLTFFVLRMSFVYLYRQAVHPLIALQLIIFVGLLHWACLTTNFAARPPLGATMFAAQFSALAKAFVAKLFACLATLISALFSSLPMS